ncbi:MAG: phage/plasmid primase, P4 family [Promethearchaeia archaeon]
MSAKPSKPPKPDANGKECERVPPECIGWNNGIEYVPWLYARYAVLDSFELAKELVDTADDHLKHEHVQKLLDTAQHVLNAAELDSLKKYIIDEYGSSILRDNRNEFALAEDIVRQHEIYLPRKYKSKIIVYEDGYYQKRDKERYLSKIIIDHFDQMGETDQIKTNKINLIKTIIESKIQCDLDIFYQDRNWLNFKNGLLNLDRLPKIEFIEHSSDIKTIVRIPVTFNPFARNERTHKFIKEVVGESHRKNIYKFLGDVLTRKVLYDKAIVLYGDGANGKSTLLEMIGRVCGKENYAKVALQSIAHERFALGDLQDKILNMHDDLPKAAIKYTQNLKTVISEEQIMGEKKYENRFLFTNICKHIFACNQVPRTKDDTKAFFRRFILIICKLKLKEDEKDPLYLEKILTEREKSGLINRALLEIPELRKHGYRTVKHDEVREQWMKYSKPIIWFGEENLESGDDLTVEDERLLESFNTWARERELKTLSMRKLTKALKREYSVKIKRKTTSGVTTRYYKGISLIDNDLEEMRVDDLFK